MTVLELFSGTASVGNAIKSINENINFDEGASVGRQIELY